VTSKGRIEVRRIGDPLFCGLELNQIHRILSMNSAEMRIRSEFSSKANELKRRFEVHRVGDPLFCGLELEQVHRILLMNFGEMRIRSEFSNRASELKGKIERS